MKDIKLYIGENLVELNEETTILYSNTMTDLTNPTAVKNSFSKTLTIKGSPNNNKIFGHYWNVERMVGSGGPNAGVYFNASKKAPFSVYVNSELYESGYVKLNKINKIGDDITYDITLFGGLGDFFYSLSFNPNTGDKLRLADLDFYTGGDDEFDFTVSATTVYEAWDALRNGREGKWQHINFMSAYNGKPSDFDADKVIMNLEGTSLPQSDESGFFRPLADNCVIADLPQEMTEWEMRDLRSYNQRPCVRMKSIISACCNPDQNGGYTVNLDPDFFNEDNPYYEKTWLSLPMMKNLEYTNQEQILEGSSLVGLRASGDVSSYFYQDLKFGVGDFGNTAPSSISVGAEIYVNNAFEDANTNTDDPIYNIFGSLADINGGKTSFLYFYRPKGNGVHNGWACFGSLYVQLIAMNGDVVVGASEAYNLTTPVRHNGKLYFGNNSHYSTANQFKPYMDAYIYDVLGEFKKEGFCREGSSSPTTINFHIYGLQSPITALKLVYFWGASDDKIKRFKKETLLCEEQDSNFVVLPDWLRWLYDDTDTGCTYNPSKASVYTSKVMYSDLKAVLSENSLGRSGTKVTKRELLNTEGSPCEYLLSYCKMFGLHFIKDKESNTIDILTRKTFYKRDIVVDLDDYIDRGKDITINPIAFTTKWYEMVHDMDESAFYKRYKSSKGVEYGSKILNTGYEFNVEKENLLKDSVIKSGIEGLERSKFFSAYNNDRVQRSWMGMGLHYNLYFAEETADVDLPVVTQNSLTGINENEGMKYYDVFPKLQFHDDDNEETDGNNVLVFFSGFKDVITNRANPLSYIISDDNAYQTIYNDGTPCWLFTAQDEVSGNTICLRAQYIPVFERYLTNNQSGAVDKSLDFGTPQELFIPDYNIAEDVNIYSNFWKTYIEDLFDANTKILSCYCLVRGKIDVEWFRRFYWFDNAVWRLNSYADWDMRGDGLTKMEFIKVQSITGYNSVSQEETVKITLVADKYNVGPQGDTITFNVTINTGGPWRITATDGVSLSRDNGNGSGTFTVTIPSNNGNSAKAFYFTAMSTVDNATARATILQSYEGSTDFTCKPENLIVPSSGGGKDVSFTWKNQGQDYVDGVDYNEGGTYLQFTADTSTYRTQNKAVLTFGQNTGNTVLSNYCQFRNRDGSIRRTVGIDQLPDVLNFVSTGGSVNLHFEYNNDVAFTNVPEWITVSGNGGNYTITAKNNPYDSDNDANITVANSNGSSTNLRVHQSNSGSEAEDTVNPSNLYFMSTDNSTKTVVANILDSYNINITPSMTWFEWLNVSPIDGPYQSGITIFNVSVRNTNTGQDRTAVINFVKNGVTAKTCTVVQLGEGSQTLTATPSALTVSSASTSCTITVVGNNLGNISATQMSVDAGMEATPLVWEGNTGTTTVTLYENLSQSDVTKTVTFSYGPITASTVFTQTGTGGDVFILDDNYITHPASGDTSVLHPTSNVCWNTSTEEITEIGFSSATWNIANLIDTGIKPNNDTTVRIKYTGRLITTDRLIGTIEGYGGCSDNEDWRLFRVGSTTYYDNGGDRATTGQSIVLANDYDITMGNGFVYDNINEADIIRTASGSISTAYTICVDVGSVWVKEVIITKSGVEVFHGVPKYSNGVVGLYDTVGLSLKTLYSGSSGTLVSRSSQGSDWITATQSGCGNDTLTITTSINTGGDRLGYVYIYSNEDNTLLYIITVSQEGGGGTLSVSPSSIVFDSNGGTATFTITCNTNWTIE